MAKKTEPAANQIGYPAGSESSTLLTELRGLIDTPRKHVAQTANATLTMLYWRMGQRIHGELLKQGRAPYGQEIVSAVSAELTLTYGKGFSARNLWHMLRFAEAFADEKIRSRLHHGIKLACEGGARGVLSGQKEEGANAEEY